METLVGREKEKAELHHSLNLSLSGEGSVVLVSGETGAGKTAFVEEVLYGLGAKVYTARADENVNTPYSLFTSIFRNCLAGDPNIECGPMKKYLSLILPELGLPPADIDAETLKESVASAVITLSTSKPIVIFFDDIHWADHASVDLLPLVADKIRNFPILLICTYRSDELTADHNIRKLKNELKRRRRLKEITISPLSFQAAKQLSETILQNEITPATADIIYKHTLGFPIYIEEIIAVLQENKLLFSVEGKTCIKENAYIPLPESIKDSVLQRMLTLPEAGLDILRAASLLGSQFRIDTLIKITSSNDYIDELFDRKWLVQVDANSASFRHMLIKEAVRESIHRNKRSEMHKVIAQYFKETNVTPEVIAEHLSAAGDPDEAIEFLIQAMDNHFAVYAYKDALSAAERILQLKGINLDTKKRIHVLKVTAECAQFTGKTDEALTKLTQLLEIAEYEKNNLLMAKTHRSIAGIYALQANWELSISTRIRAAELFITCSLAGDAASEYLAAASKTTALLQFGKAADLAQLAADIAHSGDNIDVEAKALGLLGNIKAMAGSPNEGKEMAQKALTLALDNDETEAASEIYRRLASTMEYASDYNGARATYLNAYDFCINNGKEISARVCLSCMSFIFFYTGEWKRAIDISKEVISSKYTPPTSIPVGYGVAGIIQALRGETKTALKNLTSSLNLSRKYNIPIMELSALWGFALNYEYNGDFSAAANTYNSLFTLWEEVPETHDLIPALLTASVFFNKRNLKKELSQAVGIISRISATDTSPEAVAVLSHVLAESAMMNQDIETAIKHYRQAYEHIEKTGLPLAKLLIEFRLGLAEYKSSNVEAAEKLFNRAYRAAKNLGARPLASEIAGFMISVGLRPEPERNPDSASRIRKLGLTQRQFEILELIGEGLLNKEIAAKLFLSTRTVDMHVSNILQRLNCRTRTEAFSKIRELSQINPS